jgi:hypothetical protein
MQLKEMSHEPMETLKKEVRCQDVMCGLSDTTGQQIAHATWPMSRMTGDLR